MDNSLEQRKEGFSTSDAYCYALKYYLKTSGVEYKLYFSSMFLFFVLL